MAITIAVAIRKGGVAKSTTCQVVGSILGSRGKKVLVIDLDSQRNTTQASGIEQPKQSITDVLSESCSVQQAVNHCDYYDLLAADEYLTNIERAISEEGISTDAVDALEKAGVLTISMYSLKKALESAQIDYDYIIIDTPPALGNLSYMALVAADYVLIPVEPTVYGVSGLAEMRTTITAIVNGANPALKVVGVLLTKYNRRTVLSRDMRDVLIEYTQQMDTIVFDSTIRRSVAVSEAQTVGKPLIDYAKSNNVTLDYIAFVDELLDRIGQQEGSDG